MFCAIHTMVKMYTECQGELMNSKSRPKHNMACNKRSLVAELFAAYLQEKLAKAQPNVKHPTLDIMHVSQYVENTNPKDQGYETDEYIVSKTIEAIEYVKSL